MDSVWSELAREVPSALAVILTVYLFLKAEKEREIRREANAKEKSQEDRNFSAQVNAMWANNIATLVGKQDATFQLISNSISSLGRALKQHDEDSQERYERIGITQDLIKMARERDDKAAKKV